MSKTDSPKAKAHKKKGRKMYMVFDSLGYPDYSTIRDKATDSKAFFAGGLDKWKEYQEAGYRCFKVRVSFEYDCSLAALRSYFYQVFETRKQAVGKA